MDDGVRAGHHGHVMLVAPKGGPYPSAVRSDLHRDAVHRDAPRRMGWHRRTPAPFTATLFAVAAAMAIGCGDEATPTQTVIEFAAGEATRALAATATITVFRDDGTTAYDMADVVLGADATTELALAWPVRLPVVPGKGRAGSKFAVRMTLFDAEGRFLSEVEGVESFAKGRKSVVERPFRDECMFRDCPGGFACEVAECEDGAADACVPTYCKSLCPGEGPPSPECPQGQSVEGLFVDGDAGSDTDECGGIDAPCKTLSQAWARVAEAEGAPNINVRGGMVYDRIESSTVVSGTQTEPVILRAWPGDSDAPVVNATGSDYAFYLLAGGEGPPLQWLTLEGLEIRGARAIGIWISTNTAHVELRHNYVHSNGAAPDMSAVNGGVLVDSNASDVRLLGNVIVGHSDPARPCGACGLGVAGGIGILGNLDPELSPAAVELTGNAVAGNQGPGVTLGNLPARGSDADPPRATVRFNRIYGNGAEQLFTPANAPGAVNESDNCSGTDVVACPPPPRP